MCSLDHAVFPAGALVFLTVVIGSFLSHELQVKGKAAIDGLGSRLGKSGASFMQQGLVLAFGNILNAAPIVAGMYYRHLS